jgi:hypothetical protein
MELVDQEIIWREHVDIVWLDRGRLEMPHVVL